MVDAWKVSALDRTLAQVRDDLAAAIAGLSAVAEGRSESSPASMRALRESLAGLDAMLADASSPAADAQLGGSENIFNLVVEAAPSAIVVVDERGRIALVNAQTEKLFAYTRAELLGQSIDLLVPERFRRGHAGLRASFSGAPIARPMGAGRDLYARRKDGSEIPVEIGLNPVRTGTATFTLAAISDITARKLAEELRLLHAGEQQRAAELEAARERKWSTTFQRAVLPVSLPAVPGCAFDAVYEPGLGEAQVGGDWYDAVQLADGRVLVSIGDVAGSGLEAAVVVGVARQVMRGISQLHADPMLILDAADRALCLEYPGVYVSAWVALIDLVSHTISYASAGHPPPLLVSITGEVRELDDATTLLIGLREDHRGQPSTVALAQGDTLVLYTDGVTEAGRDVMAGTRSLIEAAARYAPGSAPHPANAIRHQVIPDGSLDDVALLVVRTDCRAAERFIERWRFDALDARAARTVREGFVASLERHGFSSDDRGDAELIFSELVGNVVRHAASAATVEAAVDHGSPYSVLHIFDSGSGFYHVSRPPPEPYAEDGRGLFVISALSVDFTVSERPDGGSHARVVLHGGARNAGTRTGPLRARSMN
jgi:PAS domain S-box-containing protein